jgi:hypothetical protein
MMTGSLISEEDEMKAKFVLTLAALVVMVMMVPMVAIAEEPAEIGPRYAEAQDASMEKLKQYKWSTETYLEVEGETKFHFILACRLNEKGEMVREVESSESTVRRKRGFRGLAQQQKAEEAGKLLDQIVDVTVSYIYMTKDEVVEFFNSATITDGTGDDAGKLIVKGSDVTVKGDKVTKVVNPETLFPVRITFESTAGDVPISGEILFRPIEGGPNVPRMATINVPSKEGVVEAEFLDYAKQL